jgi:hypothetical protein
MPRGPDQVASASLAKLLDGWKSKAFADERQHVLTRPRQHAKVPRQAVNPLQQLVNPPQQPANLPQQPIDDDDLYNDPTPPREGLVTPVSSPHVEFDVDADENENEPDVFDEIFGGYGEGEGEGEDATLEDIYWGDEVTRTRRSEVEDVAEFDEKQILGDDFVENVTESVTVHITTEIQEFDWGDEDEEAPELEQPEENSEEVAEPP